ncbi:MAG: type I-E CRISPR-associated protein Cse2/CasB [Clostridia bacterium]|nr:type I-E CRISPR-associated protein Cse2/CasB [Clostridia bacterium]
MSEPKWDLSRLSAGEKSALRRNVGVMKDFASMQALEAFYRAKNQYCGSEKEKAWFASMCLECLWREEKKLPKKSFPYLLRMLYQDKEVSKSLQNRCINLLDYDWTDDGFLLGKICNLIRLIRAKHGDYMPDFEMLAEDLSIWNKEGHYIRRKWLYIICSEQNESEKEEEEETNAD